MKVQNKKIIIGIIASLVLVSSISVIAPVIAHYTNSYNKNSILLSAANNYNTRKLSNIKYPESTNTLITNLTYINKYINSTLIVKENRLRLSILGGKYDKSTKYKDVDNKKKSELAQFSHALKHVHRYGDQVRETIYNSINSLNKENSVIAQIIPIIKEHPYTYNIYLNEKKIFIPNISFFININDLNSRNNLDSKTSDISNNSYGISVNNTNLNSVAFSSEEDGTGAQTMLEMGSGVYAAAFTKITFQAQIITFNKTSNTFEYETPTAKENTTSATHASTKLDSENSEISSINSLKNNNLSYFNENRIILSNLNSLSNTKKSDLILPGIPIPINPNYLPNYFNKELLNAAVARVEYNHISSFKHNHSLYYPLIFSPFLVVGVLGVIVVPVVIRYKYKKIVKRKIETDAAYNLHLKIDKLDHDIENFNVSIVTNEEFTTHVTDISTRISEIKTDIVNNPLSKSDKNRLTERFNDALKNYNTKTFTRRLELQLSGIHDVYPIEEPPALNNSSALNNVQNQQLSQVQNQNKVNIERLIENYNTSETELNSQINAINNQEELDALIDSTKAIFVGTIVQLNENDYVSKNEKTRLIGEVQNILDEISNKAGVRSNQIKLIQQAAEQKALNDQIKERNINRENSQLAIDTKGREIQSLSDLKITKEEELDESATIISAQIAGIIDEIKQKDYNPDDYGELTIQANSLYTALSEKVLNAKKVFREANRKEIQNIIDAHADIIHRLKDITQKDKLTNEAKILRDQIPAIKRLVRDKDYNDNETLAQLYTNVDSLDSLVNQIEHLTNISIDNSIHLHTIKTWIVSKITIADQRIRDTYNTEAALPTAESVIDFVTKTENEFIAPIVSRARNEAKILDIEFLQKHNTNIRHLRTHNKTLYESKKNALIKINNELRSSITNKQQELSTTHKIIHDKKLPDGTKVNSINIKEQKNKRDSLITELNDMSLQLDKNNQEVTKFANFHLPETFMNILDYE